MWLILLGALLLIFDQAIKLFLVSFLRPTETIPVIKNVFYITLVFNTGCAFGLFRNQPVAIFFITALFAILVLTYFVKQLKQDHIVSKLGAILIISGSISNLIDRARVGYVIDFLDFRIWPVFNLGDSAITVGVTIFIFQILIELKARGAKGAKKDASNPF